LLQGTRLAGSAATRSTKPGSSAATAAAFAPLKQLQQQLAQQLRQQHHLELARVAPLLAALKNTAIPLPADDLTATTLPPVPLRATLDMETFGISSAGADGAALSLAGAALASSAADAGAGASNWLCIAGFDQTVLVLPTKTRPKRLRLLANDGSVHAFLLKGRDDLRVDERLMQFMRAANALLAAPTTTTSRSSTSSSVVASQTPVAAAAAAGTMYAASGRGKQQLRVRPYSVTPFGRRAGLVQWVRHTTSLFGLVRAWQAAMAERHHAVAAAKREAAAAAAAAAAGGTSAAAEAGPGNASSSESKPDASSGVVLPLMVAAARPADAFYARLLPALQAAGVSVGAPRSSWPAGKSGCDPANALVLM
jgi:PI-3-kinase-related kinase SMG-1